MFFNKVHCRVALKQSKQEPQQRRGRNIADGIRAALLMPLKSRSQEDLLAGTREEANVAMTLTSLLLLRPEGTGPHAETSDTEANNTAVIFVINSRPVYTEFSETLAS